MAESPFFSLFVLRTEYVNTDSRPSTVGPLHPRELLGFKPVITLECNTNGLEKSSTQHAFPVGFAKPTSQARIL